MQTKHNKKIYTLLMLSFFFLNTVFAESVMDLNELKGVWKCNDYTVTYPFQINEINYFMVEYKKQDITKEWYDICETRGFSFKESLLIKDVIMSKIFDKDYPLANELGVNEGINISYNDKLKKPKVKAQRIILIPQYVIFSNLNHFDISGMKLQMTSSIIFQNSQIDDFYLDKKLRKKVLF